MRGRIIVAAALAAVAALAAAPAIADTPQPLRGHTGPGFEIAIVDANGTAVKAIDTPGTYTLVVDDRSELHDFHLVGPNVDRATAVEGMGTETWTLDLANGTYNYFCDPHATIMKGSFTVGTVTAPPPAKTPLQKLSARVGPSQRVTFVRSARAGKTQITVRDLSAADNFHLTGPGVNKRTGVAFKGTAKWTVTLKRGTYTFRSDAHAKLRGKTKVS